MKQQRMNIIHKSDAEITNLYYLGIASLASHLVATNGLTGEASSCKAIGATTRALHNTLHFRNICRVHFHTMSQAMLFSEPNRDEDL